MGTLHTELEKAFRKIWEIGDLTHRIGENIEENWGNWGPYTQNWGKHEGKLGKLGDLTQRVGENVNVKEK